MNKEIRNKLPKNPILPENPVQAARTLIKISQSLLTLADRETQALIQSDFVTFSILQDEKELISMRYMKASKEFRDRLEDFRNLDRPLLDQMEDIQKQLTEKTLSNNIIVSKMHKHSKQKAHATLFTIQELNQKKPMHFSDITHEERI